MQTDTTSMNPPERTCATCKYKEAGAMVDPCFPCNQDRSIWTGQPKERYDAWVDDRLSWDEVRQREKEEFEALDKAFKAALEEDPVFRATLEKAFGPMEKPTNTTDTQ